MFTEKVSRRDENVLVKADVSGMVDAWGVLSVSVEPRIIDAAWKYREALISIPFPASGAAPVVIDENAGDAIEEYRQRRSDFVNTIRESMGLESYSGDLRSRRSYPASWP